MEYDYKEVYFDQYCKKCEHKDAKDSEDPCDECLANTVSLYSHKPLNYKEKKHGDNRQNKSRKV